MASDPGEEEAQRRSEEAPWYYTRIKILRKTGGMGGYWGRIDPGSYASIYIKTRRGDYFSSSFSTIIVHLVNRAPMTPNAAHEMP